jgi:hypothetical protein
MTIETKDGRGGQIGNQNAAKSRLFYDKLRKVLIQEPQRLNVVAESLIASAEAGEAWAIKELIDRVDGKAIQAVENSDGSPLLSGLQVTFVKAQ